MKMSARSDHFLKVRAQKNTKKGYFMGAKLVRKTLKKFYLTTTFAILKKLTTILYLYIIFNLAKRWDITHRA